MDGAQLRGGGLRSEALPQGGDRPRHGCKRDDALRGAREISPCIRRDQSIYSARSFHLCDESSPFMRRDQSIYFRGTSKPVRLFCRY